MLPCTPTVWVTSATTASPAADAASGRAADNPVEAVDCPADVLVVPCDDAAVAPAVEAPAAVPTIRRAATSDPVDELIPSTSAAEERPATAVLVEVLEPVLSPSRPRASTTAALAVEEATALAERVFPPSSTPVVVLVPDVEDCAARAALALADVVAVPTDDAPAALMTPALAAPPASPVAAPTSARAARADTTTVDTDAAAPRRPRSNPTAALEEDDPTMVTATGRVARSDAPAPADPPLSTDRGMSVDIAPETVDSPSPTMASIRWKTCALAVVDDPAMMTPTAARRAAAVPDTLLSPAAEPVSPRRTKKPDDPSRAATVLSPSLSISIGRAAESAAETFASPTTVDASTGRAARSAPTAVELEVALDVVEREATADPVTVERPVTEATKVRPVAGSTEVVLDDPLAAVVNWRAMDVFAVVVLEDADPLADPATGRAAASEAAPPAAPVAVAPDACSSAGDAAEVAAPAATTSMRRATPSDPPLVDVPATEETARRVPPAMPTTVDAPSASATIRRATPRRPVLVESPLALDSSGDSPASVAAAADAPAAELTRLRSTWNGDGDGPIRTGSPKMGPTMFPVVVRVTSTTSEEPAASPASPRPYSSAPATPAAPALSASEALAARRALVVVDEPATAAAVGRAPRRDATTVLVPPVLLSVSARAVRGAAAAVLVPAASADVGRELDSEALDVAVLAESATIPRATTNGHSPSRSTEPKPPDPKPPRPKPLGAGKQAPTPSARDTIDCAVAALMSTVERPVAATDNGTARWATPATVLEDAALATIRRARADVPETALTPATTVARA